MLGRQHSGGETRRTWYPAALAARRQSRAEVHIRTSSHFSAPALCRDDCLYLVPLQGKKPLWFLLHFCWME